MRNHTQSRASKKELDNLKHTNIKSTLYTNYIPIHIVTIIEQFLRVMIKKGRIKHKGRISVISISTLVAVFEDIYNHNLRDEPNHAENIRVFCISNDKCRYNPINNNVIFKNTMVIGELVEYVLGMKDKDVAEWLELYCYSFQNIGVIEPYVGTLFEDKDITTKYMMMFDTRHNLVHTLNKLKFNKKEYFNMVRTLFKKIEDNNK